MNSNKPLFFASFMTLIAAGVGFAIRGAILGDWGEQFGFTKAELGTITGGGLVGFGITILVFSLFADRIGYKPLMVLAFLLHVASAVVTLAATPLFEAKASKELVFGCLYWGAFLFSLANGVCETVINPLVATLYPKQKTHYLNILHAGWPGGLIVGGLIAYFICGRDAAWMRLRWEIPMGMFLVPTLIYGLIMLKEKFPISEAKAAGVSVGTMLSVFASPILILLLLLHAMVGYVELGTDSWITNIMNNVIPGRAVLLFVYTSGLMFVLRFFAGPIVEKINPVGLLAISGVLGCAGLVLLSRAEFVAMAFLAGTIYGVGKTFLWPTMLGVVGERFPKGGALAMGAMGGVGMLSAGLLGGPGIGYKQDLYAVRKLKETTSPAVYESFVAKAPYSKALNKFVDPKDQKADKSWPAEYGVVEMRDQPKTFLPGLPETPGLDGGKVGALKDQVADNEKIKAGKEVLKDGKPQTEKPLTEDEKKVLDADLYGGRMALLWTAIVPATMAVLYFLLWLYFQSTGGYKIEHLHGEVYTGGVEGPVEG